MKNIFIAALSFISLNAFGQDYPENEVKYNILNTMLVASVEVGYERFVDRNQSIDFEFMINDRFNYQSESGSRKFNTNAIKLGYNYYFGEGNGNGLYANPFVKYRFGDFTETKEGINLETDMNSFILGLGAGYKWNSGDKFVFGPYATIGRNFGKESSDRFQGVDFNAGISIGYRF
jgi:hypothetical protein